jgi:hypothetical protein
MPDIEVPNYVRRHTVVVRASSMSCGNCGADANPEQPTTCPQCATTWRLMVSHFYAPEQTTRALCLIMEDLFPAFSYIGHARAAGLDGYFALSEVYEPTPY